MIGTNSRSGKRVNTRYESRKLPYLALVFAVHVSVASTSAVGTPSPSGRPLIPGFFREAGHAPPRAVPSSSATPRHQEQSGGPEGPPDERKGSPANRHYGEQAKVSGVTIKDQLFSDPTLGDCRSITESFQSPGCPVPGTD